MTASLLGRTDLLEARVPRYTSYPTAPHFHAGVTGETLRGWLADLPDGMPLSLYLHVPVLRHAVLVLRLPHHGS